MPAIAVAHIIKLQVDANAGQGGKMRGGGYVKIKVPCLGCS